MHSGEHRDSGEPNEPGQQGGLSRREVMRRGIVIAGTAAWTVPTVQTIGMRTAFAAEGTPMCQALSFDVRALFEGIVSGDAGPVREFPKDGDDCFSNLTVTAPGATNPFLTADTLCVGGSRTQQQCSAFVEHENARLDLTNVDPLLDVQLSASVLRGEAAADCDTDGASGSTTLTAGEVCVLGMCHSLDTTPPPNTTALDVSETLATGETLEVLVVLNEQSPIDDGIQVTAVHVVARLTDSGGAVVQSADVRIAHAQAAC